MEVNGKIGMLWTSRIALLTSSVFIAIAPPVAAQSRDEPAAYIDESAEQREAASRQQPDVDRALAAYERGDKAEAEQRFSALARQGNRLAEFNLAVMHVRGESQHVDQATALALLLSAATHGLPDAMAALGESYEAGLLTPKDLDESTRWYERAAKRGHIDAAVSAGTAYYLGRGAPHNEAIAAAYYLQAAQGGDVGAQYLYASMRESGRGVPRDPRIARYWYAEAAKLGDVGAAVKVRELDGAE